MRGILLGVILGSSVMYCISTLFHLKDLRAANEVIKQKNEIIEESLKQFDELQKLNDEMIKQRDTLHEVVKNYNNPAMNPFMWRP